MFDDGDWDWCDGFCIGRRDETRGAEGWATEGVRVNQSISSNPHRPERTMSVGLQPAPPLMLALQTGRHHQWVGAEQCRSQRDRRHTVQLLLRVVESRFFRPVQPPDTPFIPSRTCWSERAQPQHREQSARWRADPFAHCLCSQGLKHSLRVQKIDKSGQLALGDEGPGCTRKLKLNLRGGSDKVRGCT